MDPPIPKTMKAFAIDRLGEVGSVQNVPVPEIGPTEFLVHVRSAGVNPIDLKIRAGKKTIEPISFPHVLGQDAAGVVVRVGVSVTDYDVGSEVYGAFWLAGTFAEYVRVRTPEVAVAHKPSTLDFTQAAALPTPALAAHAAIKALSLCRGETVLVNGATGGVGSYAVQMAHFLQARVIATARPDAQAYMRELGADEVIDYTQHELVAAVRDRHPRGIDAVIDVVSNKATLLEVAGVLRRDGRMATTLHAADEDVLAGQDFHAVNVDVFGKRGDLVGIAKLVDDQRLASPMTRVLPLDAAAEALAELQAGHTRGKIVLRVSA